MTKASSDFTMVGLGWEIVLGLAQAASSIQAQVNLITDRVSNIFTSRVRFITRLFHYLRKLKSFLK